jgi:UDP-N-acetyl-L-fucosamine synthase
MKKLKVMTVVGTRPEIIRLSEVLKKLDQADYIDHVLVHTGQNYDYELNQIFFEDLGLRKPDYYLDAAGTSPSITIGNILTKIDSILDEVRPDKFLILGDTNSSLAAIAAKKKGILVYHCEAGNRCFDSRVPEELNRRLVDHISDVNLPYSSIARDYLIQEGILNHRIIVTGSPMREVLEHNRLKIEASNVLENLSLTHSNYIVVSLHREENVSKSEALALLVESLHAVLDEYKIPMVVSLHPRTKLELEKQQMKLNKQIFLMPPLSFTDYIKLQQHAKFVLSDSGTISEEAAILNLNAINVRRSQERPEALNHGVVPLSGLDKHSILQSIAYVLNRNGIGSVPNDYMDNDFSDRVINALLSNFY